MSWVLEFRSGLFFNSPEAEYGATLEEAMHFSSREEAAEYFKQYEWVWFNGGMLVERE